MVVAVSGSFPAVGGYLRRYDGDGWWLTVVDSRRWSTAAITPLLSILTFSTQNTLSNKTYAIKVQQRLEGGGGCKSACQAYGAPQFCCISSSDEPETCKPTEYTQWFRSTCPRSYSAMFNDVAREYICDGADYTITICPSVDAFSTIKLGSHLKSTDQLVSMHGKFTLGFFGQNYTYLGIWYNNDVQSRKVWVANPNEPIESTLGSHALSIDPKTGNLIISAGGRTLMSITDVQVGPTPNLTATLEDTGNFRLVNIIDKSVLWQSFDHPSNTLLPGMKLGSSTTTGQNWTLTSWLSNIIRHSGAFTLSWEPIDKASKRLIIRRRGEPYWTSGDLYNQSFPNLFALNSEGSQSQYILTSVYNSEQRYFSYKASDVALPMWILNPKGQLITDSENSTALTPEFCYGYNSSNGCLESSLPKFRRFTDGFSLMNGDFATDMTQITIKNNPSLSIGDCFVECWNDCTCVGFNTSNSNETGCIFWTGSDAFLVNPRENSTFKYVINPSSFNPCTGNKTKGKKNWIWILIGVAISLVFLC